MVDDLEKADAEWRATNPEKASEIPFDMYSTELDDALAPYLKEH